METTKEVWELELGDKIKNMGVIEIISYYRRSQKDPLSSKATVGFAGQSGLKVLTGGRKYLTL